MPQRDARSPAEVLATGAAIALVLLAGGYALQLILPAIGTAFGLFVATATTGLATGGAVAAWVAPTAAAGLGATGVVLTVNLLVHVEERIREKPYEWTLPLLGAASGLTLNLWKDLTAQPQVVRLGLGGVVALFIVVAGACYKRAGLLWKCTAALLYIIPPFALVASEIMERGDQPMVDYLDLMSGSVGFVIIEYILIAVVVILMERASRE